MVAERDRWVLWVPVAIGFGILLYFSLSFEPPLWGGLAALLSSTITGFLVRDRPIPAIVAAAFGLIAIGFSAAQLRTASVRTPLLEERIGPVQLEGRIAGIESLQEAVRLILSDLKIPGLGPEATPVRIRVRLNADRQIPPVGAVVQLRAVLNPLPPPVSPGAYDFQRHAFYQRVGGTGFALGPLTVVDAEAVDWWGSLNSSLEQLRRQIARQAKAVLPVDEASVAIALMIGEQTGIPKPVIDHMRDSGLAHLLSISGLHISLVASMIFVTVRAFLAAWEGLALRYPIKKWAALAAFAAAAAYTTLVQAPVPTLRSLLMTGVVLFAIMVDRNPISMRLVAFAATVVLLTLPEAVLGASFQMSFAAVAALIAAYEVIRVRWRDWRAGASWLRIATLYLMGVALTSVIAGIATTPFSLFHFQQIQWYGLMANMIAVPVTAFWVMPWTVIVYVTMPFGLETWPMDAMGWGITIILATAEWVAKVPGAVSRVWAMPMAGFTTLILGGLWLTLWQSRWRLLGLIGIAAGLSSLLFVRPPDILVSADAKLVATRGNNGALTLSTNRAARFSGQAWLRRDGEQAAAKWPSNGTSPDGSLSCDALGCMYRVRDHKIAIIKTREAIQEDCWQSSLVISLVAAGRRCRAPLVVDWFDIRRDGAHAFYVSVTGIEVETVRRWRGTRPWTGVSDEED